VRGAVESPGLMVTVEQVTGLCERLDRRGADDIQLELGERGDDLGEALCRNCDLEVLVLAALAAEEQVDRPAGCDGPRSSHGLQARRRLLRAPGLPLRVVPAH